MRDVIIHDAPTDWINPPRLDATLAIHTARKIGMLNADVDAEVEGTEVIGCKDRSQERFGSP
ncbi:hypothetical protein [Sphingobium sp. SCG-1]|uniref:hypothetical protein n=1 Tax=Sphingobium sp. SCG-1 TaxID=2072936 RepID=UPI0021D52D1C|nr:hypothetical protein [Sphingobium sp. SCG-1]